MSDDPEGRYQPYDPADGRPLSLCLQCGCVVVEREWHDGWHYDTEVGADEDTP